MLNQLNILTKRVGGSNDLVDHWLHARRQLLVAYYHMVGIKPNRDSLTALDEKALDEFCQNLVDYLSTGHFSIYERIIEEMAEGDPLQAAAQIYPALQANTDALMELYDSHFEAAIDQDNCLEFQAALSKMGEILASRFTLEDKLIQLTLDNHLAKPAAANDGCLVRPA
ncbi:anti-RNA polymerase sigma 70 factor [Erwinia sp. OLTSP20]|uniref:sigma D regulator n=1 Tax=unclassified Erwinia TaxID=2622719 RepID=UPI000C1A5FCC|nr:MULTISPECIES: sigma D regulator [unclassified Erwinia]PIJ48634.1 anti-RNA polymerase sigma 70 factor [Erwinia sp. OAMSP11]PIJ66885.1 anti-RNA polymerase sigma 70 factor [Erwinia sp. OLSSP12]PIJ78997.1 anti-RNA polymerase sigma 70 factor [Erwinia sp. OLCASP19]PIJ79864.1 anti-RNA polymerase sigma 70 factor [Erwinia sp. OLMTSP26]PIJ81810.1 anti-RNA polymerase sigma 70 factor [Erwinia sp. OLMDSP33]